MIRSAEVGCPVVEVVEESTVVLDSNMDENVSVLLGTEVDMPVVDSVDAESATLVDVAPVDVIGEDVREVVLDDCC